MSLDFDLEVLRRGDAHIIVARQYGVVVRSKDLTAGLREAQARIEAVAADLREAGLTPGTPVPGGAFAGESWSRLALALAPSIAVAALFSVFLLLASLPLVNAAGSLRHGISAIMPSASADTLDAAGRASINYLTRIANAVEQMTPERKEELKTAVRKIVVGLRPALDEARAATTCEVCPPSEPRR